MGQRLDNHSAQGHVHHIRDILKAACLAQHREFRLKFMVRHGGAYGEVEVRPFAQTRIVQGTFPDLILMLQVDTHHPRRQARFQQLVEQCQQRREYPLRCIVLISRNIASVVLQ
ncbi:hypothetical protein D3C76_1128680 [compost metagenome]